ncbi:hypothetical protein EHO60_14335 [Leptospira fletcheri]|uniref:IPT/TIG domain-containing protein n=1 Tax=Leptospira fletcheri TaxID=2484981 RepID=A0A4R9GAT1_9LEPT|nr:IPT/TIG domain-containing protein [Leptospira fletcheri]TGK08753.1 hypothetical protein EHO60_14335 [Leptospira fletcheri]
MSINWKYWKAILGLLAITMTGAMKCRHGNGGNDNQTLLAFLLLNSQIADFVFDLGFPGSQNTITGYTFSGIASDYTVTIGSVQATGITLVGSTGLQFVMPTISGISENTTVPIVVTQKGAVFISKTARYRPLVAITIGQPNGLIRPISPQDPSSFFSFNTSVTGDHLFNTFGYSATSLNFYYFTSPTSGPTTIVESNTSAAQFKKVTLSSTGNYIFQVKYAGGLGTSFSTNIANGSIVPASTFNEINSQSLCYDFMGSGSAADVPDSCTTVNASNLPNRTGRCTYPTTGGINTRNYYNISGFGFIGSYAQTTCTTPGYGSQNEGESIFQAN